MVIAGRFTQKVGWSVPHMGWNRLRPTSTHPLLAGLPDVAHVYFVHSYFVPVNDATIAAASMVRILLRLPPWIILWDANFTRNDQGRSAHVFCRIFWRCHDDFISGN